MKPAQQREAVAYFWAGFKVSEWRACEVAGVPRSSCRYQSQAKDQTALRIRLRDLAGARVRYGYRRLHILLAREGWHVNHKRVFRLYRQEGLSLRLKARKKRVSLPIVLDAERFEYNRERPHSALGNRTPAEFLGTWEPLAKAGD